MTFFLRTLVWYLAALLVGAVFWRDCVPFIASILQPWMFPGRGQSPSPEQLAFAHHVFIRGGLVLVAAGVAALLGFLMVGHQGLRRFIITLPITAPLIYCLPMIIFYP